MKANIGGKDEGRKERNTQKKECIIVHIGILKKDSSSPLTYRERASSDNHKLNGNLT